jgi:hypothetical protein
MVSYSGGGTVVRIASLDILQGGDDTLNAGAGNDILIGGQGRDLLYGTLGEDLLFGSYASITLTNGLVTSIEFDMQDFMSQILIRQFDSVFGDGEDDDSSLSSLTDLSYGLSHETDAMNATGRPGSAHDPDLFRNIFSLGNFGPAGHLRGSSPFDAISLSGTVSRVPGSSYDSPPDRTGNTDGEERAEADRNATADFSMAWHEGQYLMVAAADVPLPPQQALAAADDLERDTLVLGLGLVGLRAAQQPERRQRLFGRVLDRLHRSDFLPH